MIRCPYCDESYYEINYSTSTAMYCPTIYKNGEIISQDSNYHNDNCTCLACGKKFGVRRHLDELDIYKLEF